MPTYQYACTDCGHDFEQFQSFSDGTLTTCPSCEGRLRKVYNAVGVVFKGSGFYRNDSRTDARNGNGTSNGNDKSNENGNGNDSGNGSETATSDSPKESSTSPKESSPSPKESSTPKNGAATGRASKPSKDSSSAA